MFSLEDKVYEVNNKTIKWNLFMIIGIFVFLIILVFLINNNNELGIILITIPTGALYAGLHYHFKNIKSYKGFKITQLIILVIYLIAIVGLSVVSEIKDDTSGAVFIIVFLGTKELVDYIIDGIPIIKNEPKKNKKN